MTRIRYRKKRDRDIVVVPGVGRVAPGQVLEGIEYERFAKLGLLERIDDAPPSVKPQAVEEPVSEPEVPEVEEPIEAPAVSEKAPTGSGVDLPDARDFEDAEIQGGQKASSEEASWEVESPTDETDAVNQAKMEKRAAARRKRTQRTK